ncbi:MAG: serine hydrolase domain-containing protein, partial [Panacagrimonas sp.]
KARLRPPKSQPTLRQLLTHSSGLAYEIWNVDAGRELEQRGVPNILSGTRATFERPLQADPGERWEYDVGIDFAGRMVEEVSGMRLGEYMKANLFAPLGMTEAGFTPRPDQTTRMATVHARNADLSLSPYPFELPQPPEVEMGGHGLFGTASDYLRFQRMILGGGQLQGARVLQSETVAQMSQNQMGDCSVKAMPAALPYSHAVDMYPGIDCKWGLSFMINTAQTPQGRSAGSLAWAGLANSYYWIDAKKQVCGLFVTQILPFYDPVVVPLLGTFETEIYQSLGKERSYFSSASKLSSSAPSST